MNEQITTIEQAHEYISKHQGITTEDLLRYLDDEADYLQTAIEYLEEQGFSLIVHSSVTEPGGAYFRVVPNTEEFTFLEKQIEAAPTIKQANAAYEAFRGKYGYSDTANQAADTLFTAWGWRATQSGDAITEFGFSIARGDFVPVDKTPCSLLDAFCESTRDRVIGVSTVLFNASNKALEDPIGLLVEHQYERLAYHLLMSPIAKKMRLVRSCVRGNSPLLHFALKEQ